MSPNAFIVSILYGMSKQSSIISTLNPVGGKNRLQIHTRAEAATTKATAVVATKNQ